MIGPNLQMDAQLERQGQNDERSEFELIAAGNSGGSV